ncbi:RNA polymerase I termination factor [Heracleum sosnowskyi]|uniref:RNA polymerase I termination factor n=1 Tax=Heracleum sosnowskyi TaxID=360622 RepID=A0AAD8HKS5_9APIA|nr:RNA polymerase I termination factor [Heracleum sosnowskyi]
MQVFLDNLWESSSVNFARLPQFVSLIIAILEVRSGEAGQRDYVNMSKRVGESEVVGKSGKKSKRSEKVEMDGIGVRTVVEEDGLGKVEKKSKKSKKKEMGGVEEMNDRTDVELEKKLESGVRKKKKKSKGNDMVAGEESVNGESFVQIDTDKQLEKVKKKKNKGNIVSGEEPGNKESIEKFDAENRSEKVKKKKKEKRMLVSREEVTDRVDAVVTEEASLNKRGKKLKNVNENQVPLDSSPNDTQDEDNTVEKRKKKKTKRRSFGTSENSDTLKEKPETKAEENSNVVGNVEKKKIKKRKRSVEEDDNDKEKKNSARREDVDNSLVDDGMVAIEKVKKKKKKRKNEKITDKDQDSRKAQDIEATNVSKKEKTKSVDNDHNNPKSKEKKKVRFSNDNEVFPSSDEENEKGRLVQGKRFTPEEDEIVMAAVQKYIESHCLGEKGLEMVLNCKSHRQVRNCWKEIAVALPHRPKVAVYYRAHILFEGRGERHKWTEEEKKMLLEHYEKHGSNWKLLAKEFKRHRFHVKDTWRRIKMERKRGHWSQEEYQKLFDYVNIDLQAKVNEEKKSKHGMLRDNICWGAISDRLSTRGDSLCCIKWYNQLTSSMVAEGIWDVADDYRLIDALFKLDACCIDDVDWDYLIERSGDVCRKRWDQMVLHIGEHKVKSFAEQVEVLANRYCPELLEAREVWDSKPLVP